MATCLVEGEEAQAIEELERLLTVKYGDECLSCKTMIDDRGLCGYGAVAIDRR